MELSTLVKSNAAFDNPKTFLQASELLLDLLLLLLRVAFRRAGDGESSLLFFDELGVVRKPSPSGRLRTKATS